ncbi:hypothetical protein U6G28_08915 [Actinomycetaceae bacterium MB13-C1-2]|nr:hypothetical protein U6G28_08915 [Actinomycetaceae bacterium MB13-C1-2]
MSDISRLVVAWVSTQQRHFYNSTRGIATVEQRLAWEAEAEQIIADHESEIRADEQRKALEKLSARVARKETEWDRQPGKHAAGMSHAAGKIRVYISEQIEKGKRP